MSDSVATEQADLSSLTSSPGSKRKRELDSPGSQRAKRAAPPAAMTAETAAFIENAIEATHAAAANGVNVADFNALQQAAAADHTDASDPANATSTAQAALGMYPTLHVPPSTEEQFAAQAAAEGDHHSEAAFNAEIAQPDMMDPSAVTQQPPAKGGQPPAHRYSSSSAGSNPKPTVGSEEWHKMRKDNHKEVERRRRETINEGINELAKIVPGCEKNKGSILQRAVSFISQLQANEQRNIERWTLEKLLIEQAISELSASNANLKQECERVFRELETWKRVAQNAGLEPPQPEEEPNTGASSS
ncbi:Helix-loop-helix protein that binds the motif CACRTG [Metarhizium guizhouense ARSEF 977]|uniref:Helix-loop-helix protein that binds the motif CACRTG n=1 Tax=Metarhizium guizhouense (strain ARSEF 977) TaxID=1276136 RepID=A0A0B4I7U0_METGA|nr:Helix-loop-helix protein that binds the motif CACRTG [Metarhizium guizhouense ARSEF 977]